MCILRDLSRFALPIIGLTNSIKVQFVYLATPLVNGLGLGLRLGLGLGLNHRLKREPF